MEERLFKMTEVADQLRVSRMTVWNMIKRGELRAIRIGRLYRIPQSAVDEILAKAER